MRYFAIVILLFFIVSCKIQQQDKYDKYYDIIDEFVRFQYYDSDIAVVTDLLKVTDNGAVSLNSNGDTLLDVPPPPPPPGLIVYDKELFSYFHKSEFIDSVDVSFMYNQIKTLKDFNLDSTKINKLTLRKDSIMPLFKTFGIDSAYKILEHRYKASSFLQFSSPIISKDGTKMLFDLEYHCGGLCGYGMTYLLELKNNKWRIIYKSRTWIS